ncbi:DUF4214 domain-containing protein [Acetobacter fallax]|nr:DUF4214 domain-containing protein [Acetobacter fallax]
MSVVSSVEQFYNNILQRQADSSGLAYWVNAASSGTSLDSVESQLATSAEAQTNVDPIIQMYQGILGRAPDAAGLHYWVSMATGGVSSADIASQMISSAEGQAIYGTGALTNDAITSLYEHALGRAPADSEISFWVNSGDTLSQAAVGIVESNEANGHLATSDLNYLLNIGQGLPASTPNQIAITGTQTTYTGTSGNDVFTAPTTITANGTSATTLQSADTITGNGGNDTLNVELAAATTTTTTTTSTTAPATTTATTAATTTYTPTLTGIGNIELFNSPAATGTIDLINTTGVTTAGVENSSKSQMVYDDASSVTTANIDNSTGAAVTIDGTTTSSFTANVNASAGSTLNVTGSASAPLSNLALNLQSGSSASLSNPDTFTANVTNADALKTLTINSDAAGAESLAGTGMDATGAVTVANEGATSGTTGSLDLSGETFTQLSTFDSTTYTGSITGLKIEGDANAASATLGNGNNAAILANDAKLTSATTGNGNNSITLSGDNSLTSISVGNGNNDIDLSNQADSTNGFAVTLGNGNNTVALGAQDTTKATFTAGTGANTIKMTDGAITTGGDKFSNFSTLELGADQASPAKGTFDLSQLAGTGVSTVQVTGNQTLSNVVLDNASDGLTLASTSDAGSDSGWVGNMTVNLGKTSGNTHTLDVSLNAVGGSGDTTTGVTGQETAGTLTLGQVAGQSASFMPGHSTETLNIASTAVAGGTASATDYTNTLQTIDAANLTNLNLTDNAALSVGDISNVAQLSSIQASGSGDLTISGIDGANNLSSFDASSSTGQINLTTDLSGDTSDFVYKGSSGNNIVTVTENAGSTATDSFTGGTGNDTFNINEGASGTVKNSFTGGAGDDTFNINGSNGENTFHFNAASDSALSATDPAKSLTYLNSKTDTISGFTTGDQLDLSKLGLDSADVLIAGASSAITGTITSSADLTSVADLFKGATDETLYSADTPNATESAARTTDIGGVLVSQTDANNVYVFVDADNSHSFSASSDMVIHLQNDNGLSAASVARDIQFA